MENGAIEDLAPVAAQPPNEVMGAVDALNRIQHHQTELDNLRAASDHAYQHLEAGRVEVIQRQEQLAQGLLRQAEHAAQQGADLRRLNENFSALNVAHRREIADPKFPQWISSNGFDI